VDLDYTANMVGWLEFNGILNTGRYNTSVTV